MDAGSVDWKELVAEPRWIAVADRLPDENKYVLIHLKPECVNWNDPADMTGVYFKVAKLVRGISLEERAAMRAGTIPNPVVLHHMSRRSEIVTSADQTQNNLVPYLWATFGPGSFFGQYVDYWIEIPPLAT